MRQSSAASATGFHYPHAMTISKPNMLLLTNDATPAISQRQSSITIQQTHTHTHTTHPKGATHSIATSATYSTNAPEDETDSGHITEALFQATRTGIEALAVAANLRSAGLRDRPAQPADETPPRKRQHMSLDDLLDAATLSAAAGLSMVSKAQPSNSAGLHEGIGKLVQTMTASPKNQDYLASCTIARPCPFTTRSSTVQSTSTVSSKVESYAGYDDRCDHEQAMHCSFVRATRHFEK